MHSGDVTPERSGNEAVEARSFLADRRRAGGEGVDLLRADFSDLGTGLAKEVRV